MSRQIAILEERYVGVEKIRVENRPRIERAFCLRDQSAHLEYALGQFLLFFDGGFSQQVAQLRQFVSDNAAIAADRRQLAVRAAHRSHRIVFALTHHANARLFHARPHPGLQ